MLQKRQQRALVKQLLSMEPAKRLGPNLQLPNLTTRSLIAFQENWYGIHAFFSLKGCGYTTLANYYTKNLSNIQACVCFC